MNTLLSLNYKFFNLEPKTLIELIKKYDKNNLIKGFEIATKSQEDEEYAINLAQYALEKGYIINLHSPCFEEDEEIKKYIEFAAKISKKMNRKINIVYHPISANNINESKKNTEMQIEKIMKCIKENNYFKNIDLSIENLNDLNQIKRLKKEDLIEILKNNPNLKFTYDIGHEIVDEIKPNLNQKILKDRINNIHIHTHKNKEDHYPILNFQNEEELYVQRTLKEIQLENYQGNVVMEYALDYIEGKNFEIKLKNYIESAKIITTALENKQT